MCCKKLKLLLAPAFYWLFAKTYILFVGSCKSHKKPKLILVQVQDSMLYVFYCKVQAKSQLQSTIYRSHFIYFAQNTKSSFAYCGSSVPHYSFAMVLLAKNQSNFFFSFRFLLLVTVFSAKIFQHQLLVFFLGFRFQLQNFQQKSFNKELGKLLL